MPDARLAAFEARLGLSPLQRIDDPEWMGRGVELWIKRDDLLHPVVSGNKWRKLKWVLHAALQHQAQGVLSMGGAYSNYLHALAYSCCALGLACRAFVRLDEARPLTPTLVDAQDWGMQIQRVSRGDYRALRQQPPRLPSAWAWLPEGGSDVAALRGVGELAREIDAPFDFWVAACGTGATLAGLILEAPANTQVIGVAALKHAAFLYDEIASLLGERSHAAAWSLDLHSHLGGFACVNDELMTFMQDFRKRHDVPLEPVYTGKLLLALYGYLRAGRFRAGQRVLALHSGGLQGLRGFSGLISS
jgi:1-aminocyclopropane-1-carboxylate deaminase